MVVAKRKRDDEGSSLLKEDVSVSRLDTPFPRGGGSDIAPIEIKRAEAAATRDVYEEMKKSKKPKKSVKKAKASGDGSIRIDPLILTKIKVGTLLLGQVMEVHQSVGELVVSLPNNLVGYCRTSFLDTSIIGTYLRLVVTSLGELPKRRLELSYDPELVNQTLNAAELTEGTAVQGVVESVEDKGAILSLGPSLGNGFLPRVDLVENQPVLAFVKNSEKRIKQLTSSKKAAVAAVLNQPALVPGSLVELAPIEHETPFGHIYELVSSTRATSDAVHSLGDASRTPSVRVLFSYPPTQINGDRQLGVSMRSHIVTLDNSQPEIKQGETVSVTVQSVKPSVGVFVKIGDIDGFVHVSQLDSADVKLDEEPRFAVGTQHVARVLSVSPVDGLIYLSLDPEILNQRYMNVADICIGDVVENAVVERFLPKGGLLIRLSRGIIGIANEQQLSDVALKNPELRFKQGQKVTVRVLDVDVERQRIELTLKKSVVSDNGPILSGYDVVENAVGTVFRVSERGAKLLFFGGLKGWLPVSEMLESSANPEKLLRIGQTLRVRVLEADASRDRLIVSARPNSDLGEHIGEIHKASVSQRTKNEVCVNLGSDLGEVVLIDKPKVKSGDPITVKILTERLASSDPSLVGATLPRSINDLNLGEELVGYVSGTQSNIGVFVSFMDKLTGLIPASALGESNWPPIGRILTVKVDNIDFTRNRFYLSLPDSGKTVSAVITSVKRTQLNMTVNNQQGRVDVSQLFSSIDEISDPKDPLSDFKEGQTLDGLKIVGRHDARTHKFLPLSHRGGVHALLELSRVPALNLTIGAQALAFVNNVSDDGEALWISLSPTVRGRISLVDLTADIGLLKDVKANFPIGSALQVTILKTSPKLVVTALKGESNVALVSSVSPLKLSVRLPHHKSADIPGIETADELEPLEQNFERNQFVTFRKKGSQITLRSSDFPELTEGAIVKGLVKNISSGGIFVSVAPNKVGRIQIGQLSDTYLKNWQSFKRVGDVVVAKILEVAANGKIELSLKPSIVSGKKQQNIDKVEVGHSYKGTLRRIERFGVFVDFSGVTGMCHISDISERPIDDLSRVFKVGDSVKVKVLEKNMDKQQISLGMKASYFGSDDENEESTADSEEISSSQEQNVADSETNASSDDDEVDVSDHAEIALSDSDEGEDRIAESHESAAFGFDSAGENDNGLSAGFNWTGDLRELENTSDSEAESESDSDGELRVRTTRKRKQNEFVKDETAKMQARLPQSAKDFERLLVSNPNSSMLWMNYMAFQLQLGEVDLARTIAQRALSTISIREEEEKMNIWVALLNLEVQFGTAETTDKSFREALQVMDAQTMHVKMANVFAQAGKLNEAREIFSRALKRFGGDSLEIWLVAMRFYFSTGEDKTAGRELADRALLRLPRRLHYDFSRQFALLEFELGDAERGRTLFEAILASKPRRVDIWNVYIDQELKNGDETRWSGIFERVLSNKITMKQAKFFFKKWINVASDQEYVKARAKEYVESREDKENSSE